MKKSSRNYRWKQRLLNNEVRLAQYPVDGEWSPRLWRSYHGYLVRRERGFIRKYFRK